MEKKHTPAKRQMIYCDTGIYRKTWCGPYAIAVLCGTEYEEAYRAVRAVRGKRHAKGITNSNQKAACRSLGVSGKWSGLEKRTKLSKFLPTLEAGKVYVVQITKHVIVVDTRDFTTIDNQQREWIAMDATKHKNKLVHAVFEVTNPKFYAEDDPWLIEPLAASGA